MSKKKHKKIDWRAAAEALAKAEKPRGIKKEIEVEPEEKPHLAEASRGEVETTPGPNVKGEIKKIGWVASLLVLIFAATIILDRTTSLPSVFAGRVMIFLHLEQK